MTVIIRFLALAVLALTVSACSVRNPVRTNSPDQEVAAARYEHAGPKQLTLYTMVSNRSGSGAHTSLLINASERVAFDPAGAFRTEGIIAKNDVVISRYSEFAMPGVLMQSAGKTSDERK